MCCIPSLPITFQVDIQQGKSFKEWLYLHIISIKWNVNFTYFNLIFVTWFTGNPASFLLEKSK
jgi:hypothetical protein